MLRGVSSETCQQERQVQHDEDSSLPPADSLTRQKVPEEKVGDEAKYSHISECPNVYCKRGERKRHTEY